MSSSATTIGKSSGGEEPSIPPWLLGIQLEVERKYAEWCERRGLNPLDVHDRGESSLSMRLSIANQARAAVRRKEFERGKAVQPVSPRVSKLTH